MGPRKSGVVGQKQPGREDPPGMAYKNEHSVLNHNDSIVEPTTWEVKKL